MSSSCPRSLCACVPEGHQGAGGHDLHRSDGGDRLSPRVPTARAEVDRRDVPGRHVAGVAPEPLARIAMPTESVTATYGPTGKTSV
jgi:hypothetical protein